MSQDDGGLDPDAADAFTEQARALLAAHDKRSDGITQGASTLLGFLGVLLALLAGASGLGKHDYHYGGWSKLLIVLTLVLLLLSAGSCLMVLNLHVVSVISEKELRREWRLFQRGKLKAAKAQIANAHLGTPLKDDPIETAKQDADHRGHWYRRALWLLLGSLLSLTLTTVGAVLSA